MDAGPGTSGQPLPRAADSVVDAGARSLVPLGAEKEHMNLSECGVPYFPATDSLLQNRSQRSLLDAIRQQREGKSPICRQFTLPKHLPYELLSFGAIKTIIALYQACFYSRHSFVVKIPLKQLAEQALLSDRHTGLALKELEAAKLITAEKVWKQHTKITLLDPMRSGVPLCEMGERNKAEFNSHPSWYWYDLLLHDGKGVIGKPYFDFQLRTGEEVKVVTECPLRRIGYSTDENGQDVEKLVACSGNVSADRKKFRIVFRKDGTDRWHCFRCGHGGTCWDLWLRLYPKFKREQLNPKPTVVVGARYLNL